MRVFLRRALVLALAVITVGLTAALPAQAQFLPSGQPWSFTKQALGPNGAPLTGPVSVGDTITYVLSCKPGGVLSGSITLRHAVGQPVLHPRVAPDPAGLDLENTALFDAGDHPAGGQSGDLQISGEERDNAERLQSDAGG